MSDVPRIRSQVGFGWKWTPLSFLQQGRQINEYRLRHKSPIHGLRRFFERWPCAQAPHRVHRRVPRATSPWCNCHLPQMLQMRTSMVGGSFQVSLTGCLASSNLVVFNKNESIASGVLECSCVS